MEIHDHFNGCAHCVECNGDCRLKGDDLKVTRLVRFVMEQQQSTRIFWSFVDDALKELLGNRFALFIKRASETTFPARQAKDA